MVRNLAIYQTQTITGNGRQWIIPLTEQSAAVSSTQNRSALQALRLPTDFAKESCSETASAYPISEELAAQLIPPPGYQQAARLTGAVMPSHA